MHVGREPLNLDIRQGGSPRVRTFLVRQGYLPHAIADGLRKSSMILWKISVTARTKSANVDADVAVNHSPAALPRCRAGGLCGQALVCNNRQRAARARRCQKRCWSVVTITVLVETVSARNSRPPQSFRRPVFIWSRSTRGLSSPKPPTVPRPPDRDDSWFCASHCGVCPIRLAGLK